MSLRIRRLLLFLLLPSCALSVGAFYVDIYAALFLPVIPFFCLELLLLDATKKLPVRLLPAIPILLLLGLAGYYAIFGHGWDVFAALIYGLMAIAPTAGCLLALLTHILICRRNRRKGETDE